MVHKGAIGIGKVDWKILGDPKSTLLENAQSSSFPTFESSACLIPSYYYPIAATTNTAAVKMHRLKSFSLLSPEKHSTSSENPFCKINFSDRNLADVLLYHCPFGFSARSENKINSEMFLCLHGNAFCNTWRRPFTDWRQHKVLFVYL